MNTMEPELLRALKPGDRVIIKEHPKAIRHVKKGSIVGYEAPQKALLGTVKKIRKKSARIDVELDRRDKLTGLPERVLCKPSSLYFISEAEEQILKKGEANAEKRRKERDKKLKKERTEKYGEHTASHITG